MHFFSTAQNKVDIDLKKLRINTGHSSFRNIKKLLEHAGLWKPSFKEPIESIISACQACKETRPPSPAPVVDKRYIEPVFNREVEMDILYFQGKPVLHCKCKGTKLSSAVLLENRGATTLRNSFVMSCVFGAAHGPPAVLQGDPEFNNDIFKGVCES